MFGTGSSVCNLEGFYRVGKTYKLFKYDGTTLTFDTSATKHKGVLLSSKGSATCTCTVVFKAGDPGVKITVPNLIAADTGTIGEYLLPCVVYSITPDVTNAVDMTITLLD